MRWLLLACVLLAGPARAELLRIEAPCAAVTQSAQAGQAGEARAMQFIATVLGETDLAIVGSGRRSLVDPLTPGGLEGVVRMVLARCARMPAQEARAAAVAVYTDLWKMQEATGAGRRSKN